MSHTKQFECGCCEGVEILTPLSTANRPGLKALTYRVGTHATFLQTMKARLSSSEYPKLADLTTREADDFPIALLDAWATVADVLAFYQERIANEGYLRTATERRSILELARLVGYQPRPGVASSVYLAYTLDDNFKEETTIPKGARSQSVPGPGELPQSFETSEDLKARAQWNNLIPRIHRPQTVRTIKNGTSTHPGPRVFLKGISTNLRPTDPLLIKFWLDEDPVFFRVKEVLPDPAANRTLVTLQEPDEPKSQDARSKILTLRKRQTQVISALGIPPAAQLASSARLERVVTEQFRPISNATYSALGALAPILRDSLGTASAHMELSASPIEVYALRTKAAPFGYNAPPRPVLLDRTTRVMKFDEWQIDDPLNNSSKKDRTPGANNTHADNTLYLDSEYHLIPDSWIVIDNPAKKPPLALQVARSLDVSKQSLVAYGLSGKSTRLKLPNRKKWLNDADGFNQVRTTVIYLHSEKLELAEEPIEDSVWGGALNWIELDGFYEGLEAGRWIVVDGEREISGTSKVRVKELALLSEVKQDVRKVKEIKKTGKTGKTGKTRIILKGDTLHTFIRLDRPLAYSFKRDTVTIYGNVVKATHGETRKEVLGSGDGAKALQSFVLKQPPLTHVSASNPSGVDSTLKVYVNDVQWQETDALAGLSLTDRKFITKTDDESKTILVFGSGREGARLPTGLENIKAEYRNGIGKAGNVKAGQISLLSARPLGVKEVINPLRASGGADKESCDQARKNAPLAVKALDRLVSVQDYEDFARTYAGIAKARAVELSDGRRQLVHITIAGADDIPIDKSSDLYRNLRQALLDSGDPHQPIQLEIRELMLIVISARIRILPEYQWEPVVTQLRTTLLDAFGFERRELGQDVLLSEVISVMQCVRGVAYVDVDVLRGIPEKISDAQNRGKRRLLTPSEIADRVSGSLKDQNGNELNGVVEPLSRLTVNLATRVKGTILPAQLAFLTPDVPETLILNQIT